MFGGQGAGNDYGSLDYKLRGASGVQQEALDFVSKAVSAMGSPPEGLTCSEALRQLSGNKWLRRGPGDGCPCAICSRNCFLT